MLISEILKLAIFRAVRLSVWKYLKFWNLPFPGLFVSLYENIWKFKTYYFQDCLSLCTQLWRGCFCTKTRRAPPTQLPLPAGNLDTISFTLLPATWWIWENQLCVQSHSSAEQFVLAFPFIICWGWGFFVPFASQLLLCSLSFPWLHLGEKETFCLLGCSFNRVKGQFCQQETQLC